MSVKHSSGGLSPCALEKELISVAREGKEFSGSICPRISSPSPAEFLRDYVLPNRPCIITDALSGWKAMSLWTDDYLIAKMGENPISVNVTPNGRGDAVLDDAYFVMPEERQMTFSDFLVKLNQNRASERPPTLQATSALPAQAPKELGSSDGTEREVFYLSHQDDNLRTQFQALLPDVAPTIRFAEDALGVAPDAVNLWMGGAEAVTTLHMDHYENLYAVVRGEKRFTLLPPTSMPLLYPRAYEPRVYSKEGGAWHTRPAPSAAADLEGAAAADGTARRGHTWISVNPEAPDLDRFPLYRHAEPLRVAVRRGELLYLPAMWYHQVAQADDTLAVNYWYDMVYDSRFVFKSLLERLTSRMLGEDGGPEDGGPGAEGDGGESGDVPRVT